MPPKKKMPHAERRTMDSDSDFQQPRQVLPVLPAITANIEKIRSKRANVRKRLEKEYNQRVADLKNRVTNAYEAEMSRRSSLVREQLDKLANAIEKKLAYEKAILKLMCIIAEEGSDMALMMAAVYSGRSDAARDTWASTMPQNQAN
ncbi:hypothetical protein BX600DRAFT_493988 [Xylariales sp. PMI_506]|nr:hypothetical protein BX600DRAFT_493988 [Xylariales sp. PMI_506]